MTTLHLMHCPPDLRRLTVWAARHGLHTPQGDLGYALHALLHAAFGDAAPQPFCYQGERGGLLAYSRHGSMALAERAALAPPDVAAALGLDGGPHGSGLSVRPFPGSWQTDAVLGFEVRARPIQRQQGRERDAFLCAVERAKGQAADAPPLQREAVYLAWLAAQFGDAAQIVEAGVTRFQLSDVMRRTHANAENAGRRQRQVSGPDATFSGHLRICQPEAFGALVARGVGRHRAFGFGMLLLRPARLG